MFSASRTPAGTFQHCLMRACSAPTQLMDSFWAAPAVVRTTIS